MASKPTVFRPSRRELRTIRLMVLLGVLAIGHFLYWFFQEENRGHGLLFGLITAIFVYGLLRNLYLWYHYVAISIPETPGLERTFTVDILTTYFPGEPYEMTLATLEAIQRIHYPHTTYLCDEANDPFLRERCREMGIIHVTRNNRIDAKAGNINNALRQATGEICLILDPDHVPEPDFLDPVLPHFQNPEIGFVQVVQSYGNTRESLVARGAAEQTYQFYGPMMMSMNTYGTVNAIGANCTFRRAALDSIGGHAPGLAEDMHTAMQLHAKGWKSVYVPRILAKGLAPATLHAFFKQQLKWSRGTFELLFRVYPKLFRRFTLRQKFHYGLLPLHFLVGLIYLFSFSVPVLSLLLAETPWKGSLLLFLLVLLPISASNLLIRAYIQRWVMEKEERGFHLVGGLLQITTWWVYLLGFLYAIINKNVPYLPTPKGDESATNLKIVFPNILMGLVCLGAIAFGLQRDLTPYSLAMAGFAFLNALFMFFGVYLGTRVTNKNQILRTHLKKGILTILVGIKHAFERLSDRLFHLTRATALPFLLLIILLSLYGLRRYQYAQWDGVQPRAAKPREGITHLGIFLPTGSDGITNLKAVKILEQQEGISFDVASIYVPWGRQGGREIRHRLDQIANQGYLPMITWEPWTNDFAAADTLPELGENKRVFQHILSGTFNTFIDSVALSLKDFRDPVFLRFAHEFDNPAYPWSPSGGNSPASFREAWRYVHNRFRLQGADNVIWVWNPFRAGNMGSYYPGDGYVDWFGVTGLDYGPYNRTGKSSPFDSLYRPFHDAFNNLARLPVMVAEFGTLAKGVDAENWLQEALASADRDFGEIKAWTVFHSDRDMNLPPGAIGRVDKLDWTNSLASLKSLGAQGRTRLPNPDHKLPGFSKPYRALPLPEYPIRGVAFKKAQQWYSSRYTATRASLEHDFSLMKQGGVNTIKYYGPTLYDRNVLQIAPEFNLQVIYGLWIPDDLDFIRDSLSLQATREQIIATVARLKGHPEILAWNLGNPHWSNLAFRFQRPELDGQRRAYLRWLKQLSFAIKAIDTSRYLFADLCPDPDPGTQFDAYSKAGLAIDAYGLIGDRHAPLKEFMQLTREAGFQAFVSDAPAELYADVGNIHFVARNWQDQWNDQSVTFDGLLDMLGRKRLGYHELKREWEGVPVPGITGGIAILRPALALHANQYTTYQAKRFLDNQWQDPKDESENQYHWFLLKKDYYGNTIAVKQVGTGSSLKLRIPEQYDLFELMLTYESGERILSDRVSLNLPLPASIRGQYKK